MLNQTQRNHAISRIDELHAKKTKEISGKYPDVMTFVKKNIGSVSGAQIIRLSKESNYYAASSEPNVNLNIMKLNGLDEKYKAECDIIDASTAGTRKSLCNLVAELKDRVMYGEDAAEITAAFKMIEEFKTK